GEGKRGDARQVDAHQRRGAPMEGDSFEGLAGDGTLEKQPGADEDHDRYAKDEKALVAAADGPEFQAPEPERKRHRMRIGREADRDGLAEHDQHAEERE